MRLKQLSAGEEAKADYDTHFLSGRLPSILNQNDKVVCSQTFIYFNS